MIIPVNSADFAGSRLRSSIVLTKTSPTYAPRHLFRPPFLRNSLFLALRSGLTAASGAFRQKQIPSSLGFILYSCFALACVSCISIPTSTSNRTVPPAGGYDGNPPADVIIGMWTSTDTYDNGGKIVTNVLFRPDGTGLMKSFSQNYMLAEAEKLLADKLFPLSWKYEGDGWWSSDIQMQSIQGGTESWKFRVTSQTTTGSERSLYLLQMPVKPGSSHTEFRRAD